jgi:hypothetical protein
LYYEDIETSLEPLSLGKNIALGAAAEYRDDTSSTCEGETRRILMGSHEPHKAVKVVGSDPPPMNTRDALVTGNPVKPMNTRDALVTGIP